MPNQNKYKFLRTRIDSKDSLDTSTSSNPHYKYEIHNESIDESAQEYYN